MRSEEQVVEAIRKFISSSVQTDSPESRLIAERFSEICTELNERIDKCAEYLKKDMRAEAVNLAEADPPLLELVEMLKIPSLQDWLDFCSLYEWPAPPPIKEKALDAIRNSVLDQASLKPLEDEYRRKIHTGSLHEKILILRKLKILDPENGNWESNLRGFEKIRIDELTRDAKSAIEQKNESALIRINSEIASPDWLVKPEAKVLAKIAETLKGYRVIHLREKADCILKEISDAYGTFNVKSLNGAIAKWDILCGDSEFSPSDSDIKQADEARDWAAGENKKISDERNFKILLEKLEKLLDDKLSFDIVENTYSKLSQHEMEIPEILRTRYANYEEECKLSRTRSAKLKTAAALAAIVLGALILFFFINHRAESKLRADWIGEIGRALNDKSLDKADKLFEKLKEKHPNFCDKPEFLSLRKKLESLREQRELKSRRFEAIMHMLNDAASNDFQTDIAVDEKIKEAETLAELPKEQEELKVLKDKKSEYENRKQLENESQFLADAGDLDEITKKIQTLNPATSSEEFEKLLVAYQNKLDSAASRPGISPKYDTKIKLLRERLLTMKKNKEESVAEYKIFTERYNSIFSRIASISDFKSNILSFVEKYPDSPQAEGLKILAEKIPDYEMVPLIKTFAGTKLAGAEKTAEWKALSEKIPKNSIWGGEFPDYMKYYERLASNSDTVKDFFKNISNIPLINFYSVKIEKKNGDVLEIISEKQPKITKRPIINGELMPEYEILRIMGVKDSSGTYWYLERKPDKWDLRAEGKVQMREIKLLNQSEIEKKVPAFDNFKKLCVELSEAAPFKTESIVPELVEELKRIKNYPFRRLILLKHLFEKTKSISWRPEFYEKLATQTAEFIASFGDKYDYINMKPEDEKKFSDFIAGIPEISKQVESFLLERDICAEALDRSVDFIGVAVVSNDGKKTARLRKINYNGELWALRPGKNGAKNEFVIVGSTKDSASLLDADMEKSLSNAEPLFAPIDGENTKHLADSFSRRATKLKKEIKWPSCWPANGVQ